MEVNPFVTKLQVETPADRIAQLQESLRAEIENLERGLMHRLDAMRVDLGEAQTYPILPGIREEFRSLTETLTQAVKRIDRLLQQRGAK